jgi:hypothetical protein
MYFLLGQRLFKNLSIAGICMKYPFRRKFLMLIMAISKKSKKDKSI